MEKAEEPAPETKVRAMKVEILTEGVDFMDIEPNELAAAKTKQEIMSIVGALRRY